MEANEILSENIDLYLKGKLNAVETTKLENLMKTDKSVAAEVDLQSTITKVIGNDRKLELKARLDQIQVPGLMEVSGTTSTFSALKAASIILASAGLGLGAYFYANNSKPSSESIAQNTVVEESKEVVSEDNAKLLEEEQSANTSNIIVAKKKKSEEKVPAEEIKEVKSESKRVSTLSNSKKDASGKKVPNMESFEDDSQSDVKSDNVEAPKDIKMVSTHLVEASDVDIKTVQDGAHRFHYKLKNKTLFLYGSFEASPYEILEFNDRSSQILYLYYDQSFFAMNPDTEITKLRKITDKKLISELETARSR
jgi:hypothetical protein